MSNYDKYIKYKTKYLALKQEQYDIQEGGGPIFADFVKWLLDKPVVMTLDEVAKSNISDLIKEKTIVINEFTLTNDNISQVANMFANSINHIVINPNKKSELQKEKINILTNTIKVANNIVDFDAVCDIVVKFSHYDPIIDLTNVVEGKLIKIINCLKKIRQKTIIVSAENDVDIKNIINDYIGITFVKIQFNTIVFTVVFTVNNEKATITTLIPNEINIVIQINKIPDNIKINDLYIDCSKSVKYNDCNYKISQLSTLAQDSVEITIKKCNSITGENTTDYIDWKKLNKIKIDDAKCVKKVINKINISLTELYDEYKKNPKILDNDITITSITLLKEYTYQNLYHIKQFLNQKINLSNKIVEICIKDLSNENVVNIIGEIITIIYGKSDEHELNKIIIDLTCYTSINYINNIIKAISSHESVNGINNSKIINLLLNKSLINTKLADNKYTIQYK